MWIPRVTIVFLIVFPSQVWCSSVTYLVFFKNLKANEIMTNSWGKTSIYMFRMNCRSHKPQCLQKFVMLKMRFNYNTYLKKRPFILIFRSVVGGLISDRTGRRKPLVIVSCEYCLSLSPCRDRIVLNFPVQLLDISESIDSRRQVKLEHHCYQFTDE